jgi:HEAT repeat protein
MGIFDNLFGPPNLDKLRAKRDVSGLVKALDYKKDKFIPAWAANTLGEIGDPRAVTPLIAALKNNFTLSAAAKALGEIGEPQAMEPLIYALGDSDFEMDIDSIVEALDNINPQWPKSKAVESVIPKLIEKLEAHTLFDGIDSKASEVLAKIGTPAVEALIRVILHKDKKTWEWAIFALGEIRDPRAVDSLISTIKDYCYMAAVALGKIGDPRAMEPLVNVLVDTDAYSAVMEALDKIDPHWPKSQAALSLIPKLKEMLFAPDKVIQEKGSYQLMGVQIENANVVVSTSHIRERAKTILERIQKS